MFNLWITMTLVNNLDIPPEILDLWNKSCVVRYGDYGTKIDKKFVTWRKRNFPSLIARGQFQSLANLWDRLTELQKTDWDDAGYWAGMSGWDLFASDTLWRISNNILGLATPNVYHQFLLGELVVLSPAEELSITQNYAVPAGVDVSWAINVKHALTSSGAGSYAKWVVRVHTGYWNDDINSPDVIIYEYDLTEFSDWDYVQDSYIDGLINNPSVDFQLHIYKMTGSLYIDGIELNYNDQNFALDFQCNAIENNWVYDIVPNGATYRSIYPPDNI